MGGHSSKLSKQEESATKDELHTVDQHPQDDCEPQSLPQFQSEPHPEVSQGKS